MPRITSKGQVTIPAAMRDKLGLGPDTEVEFELAGNAVRIRKAKRQSGGRALVSRMKGRATARLSTDEIMALTRPKS